MGLHMKERQAVTGEYKPRYQKAGNRFRASAYKLFSPYKSRKTT
jgi:hypothetical protein